MRRTALPPASLALVAALACSGGPGDARREASSGAAGPRAEGEAWAVALEAPGPVRAGEPAEARLRVTARGGYHVNEEYPMSFRPAGDATAGLGGDRVALGAQTRAPCGGEGGGACEVTAALPFVPRAPGEARLSGTLAFSVCTAERCLIERVPLATSVAVR